jgi:hypothetical protein
VEFEIRVLAPPGQYSVWVADDGTTWGPLFHSRSALTAKDVAAAILKHARHVGWEQFPEQIAVVDEQRAAVDTPPELWSVLKAIFGERERYRRA